MARPKSDTVDYFTHDVDASSRKTLTIIEGQFGIAGYGFWYKLLEWLGGKAQGHFYDAQKATDLEFLCRKCGVDGISGTEILQKLAELGAIDPILWEHKVVWSQNFVDRLSDVYKKRGRPLPQKPRFCNGNCKHSIVTDGITAPITPVSVPETPQSKPKETIPKETIPQATPSPLEIEQDPKLTAMVLCYEQNFGLPVTPTIAEELKDLSERFEPEWFAAAVKDAFKANVRRLSYVISILERWKVEGFKSPKRVPGRVRSDALGKEMKGPAPREILEE